MNVRFCLTLAMIVVALPFWGLIHPLSLKACGYLLIGWLLFLIDKSSRMQIDWPATAAALMCLALLLAGFHAMLSWVARNRPRAADQSPRRPWALRWSASMVGVVVLMFVAGTAMIGIAHQTRWLLTTDQPLVEERMAWQRPDGSKSNLARIGFATQNFHDIRQTLPEGGTSTPEGAMLHSWMTSILPLGIIDFTEQVDYTLPWDHPKNAAEFRRFVPDYLNPRIGKFRSDDGYALAHYAGNVHVLGGGPPLRMSQVSDGTSQTLLAGEVAAEFKPWGYPMNWRDPAQGVNRLASGFASPDGEAVQFVFLDGSVRSFNKDTSPKVLRALATPRGGERVK